MPKHPRNTTDPLGDNNARIVTITALLLAFAASPGLADGDPAKGEKVFRKCKACHVIDKEKTESGPILSAFSAAPAASVEKIQVLQSTKAKAEEGLVWDEASIAAFLAAPKKYIKGTKMGFVGLKKQDDIDNIIAYIKAKSGHVRQRLQKVN